MARRIFALSSWPSICFAAGNHAPCSFTIFHGTRRSENSLNVIFPAHFSAMIRSSKVSKPWTSHAIHDQIRNDATELSFVFRPHCQLSICRRVSGCSLRPRGSFDSDPHDLYGSAQCRILFQESGRSFATRRRPARKSRSE